MSGAGWYGDPSGRHEHRYFDGESWTEHVAGFGVQSLDPVETGWPSPAPGALAAESRARRIPWFRTRGFIVAICTTVLIGGVLIAVESAGAHKVKLTTRTAPPNDGDVPPSPTSTTFRESETTTSAKRSTTAPERSASPSSPPPAPRPTSAPPVVTPLTTVPVATHDFSGTLLVDSYQDKYSNACGGTSRFSEFQVGQVISLTDSAGRTVASGSLTGCTWTEEQSSFNLPGIQDYDIAKPTFTFVIRSVRETASYNFRVSWKQWVIPMLQMRQDNWRVDLGVR
jgi:hypothetical protein